MTEAQEEKELILRNKQLISLFFVVVALCGVCFAMGYIIGHNSAKPAAEPDTPARAAARPQESEPPRETSEAPASPPPQDSSAPASDENAGAPASGDQPLNQKESRPEAQSDTRPAAAAAAAPESATPAAGSYLQVGAVSKVDAENLVRTLREQKLPALMQESPRKGLFRVLVGPYRQVADLADAKSRLKTLGFENAFVQK